MDLYIIVMLIASIVSVAFNGMDGWHILSITLQAFFYTILGIAIASIVAYWKIFQKAGEEGWKSLIPIYNIYILVVISGNPVYTMLFFLVPLLNIYMLFKLNIDLAKAFGKEVGFGIGMIIFPLLFPLILAFDRSTYLPAQTIPDDSSPEATSPEGHPTSEQGTAGQKPARPQLRPIKPEDPWVTGKE